MCVVLILKAVQTYLINIYVYIYLYYMQQIVFICKMEALH